MNDIIKAVAQKAGISEQVAEVAVNTVFSVVKNKLPAGIGDQLTALLGSGGAPASSKKGKKAATGGGDLLSGLGGLLGGFLKK